MYSIYITAQHTGPDQTSSQTPAPDQHHTPTAIARCTVDNITVSNEAILVTRKTCASQEKRAQKTQIK